MIDGITNSEVGMRNAEDRLQITEDRGQRAEEVGGWNAEFGNIECEKVRRQRTEEVGSGKKNYKMGSRHRLEGEANSEVGPVVVPKGRDYAAASMRNAERNRKEQSAEGKAI